jgi:copper chaperone
METKTYKIPNIHCHHCVRTIKTELSEQPGLLTVDGDPEKKEITVTFEEPLTQDKIEVLLKEINYSPEK